jgi:hypothetical protein
VPQAPQNADDGLAGLRADHVAQARDHQRELHNEGRRMKRTKICGCIMLVLIREMEADDRGKRSRSYMMPP